MIIKDIQQIFCKKRIDKKVKVLQKLTENFLFIEFYSHTGCDMYKIMNEYTDFKENKCVLSPISEGIEKALDLAIETITECKAEYDA